VRSKNKARQDDLTWRGMLTFFTTAKPFVGHSGIIQRNALKSWKLLRPDIEVLLFGDDEGAARIAEELGLKHEPHVERNEYGTKRLDAMFARAKSIARHDLLCYINCDIVLMKDFPAALGRVSAAHKRFLMIGRRWDLNVTEAIKFDEDGWDERLRGLAQEQGVQRGADAVDYFAFPRGFFREIPPLVVGRVWWDHWLVWKARRDKGTVIDVSQIVTAIHQNHDYGYHPKGAKGVWNDEQALRNYELAGGRRHLFTIDDATRVLEAKEERSNRKRFWAPSWRYLRPKCIPIWFAFLDMTRPLRNRLGLRHSGLTTRLGQDRRGSHG
jgi:hypothetical protein